MTNDERDIVLKLFDKIDTINSNVQSMSSDLAELKPSIKNIVKVSEDHEERIRSIEKVKQKVDSLACKECTKRITELEKHQAVSESFATKKQFHVTVMLALLTIAATIIVGVLK